MHSKIFKYTLPNHICAIKLPVNGYIVHFALQNDKFTIWVHFPFDINSEPLQELRHFQVIGTGYIMTGNYVHVATIPDGEFIWHLMEYKTSI